MDYSNSNKTVVTVQKMNLRASLQWMTS